MREYLYPTQPFNDWIPKSIEAWQSSNMPFFAFAFCWFIPHALIDNEKHHNDSQPFWLYLYYAQSRTVRVAEEGYSSETDLDVAGRILYRFRIRSFLEGKDNPYTVHCYNATPCDHNTETIWFKCDQAEEVKKLDHKYQLEDLRLDDFQHAIDPSKVLGSTIRNSIAPVCRTSPLIIRKSWQHTIEPATCSSQP